MEKRNLYLIIAIILVAGLSLSFYSNFTGQGTFLENPQLGECVETDKGDDPYTPGSVSYTVAAGRYKDECYAKSELEIKKFLKERHCFVSMENRIYKCETGCIENEEGEGYCKPGEANRIYN